MQRTKFRCVVSRARARCGVARRGESNRIEAGRRFNDDDEDEDDSAGRAASDNVSLRLVAALFSSVRLRQLYSSRETQREFFLRFFFLVGFGLLLLPFIAAGKQVDQPTKQQQQNQQQQ